MKSKIRTNRKVEGTGRNQREYTFTGGEEKIKNGRM